MSTPTFSPGPWTTRTAENPIERAVLIESDDNVIARVVLEDGSDIANTRLIAAAPTMYEALAYAVDNPGFDSAQFDRMARAALAEVQS